MRSLLIGCLALVLVGADLVRPAGAEEPPELSIVFPQPDVRTTFIDDFGFRRHGGRRHEGIDLMGERGMPVVAAADGFVERMGHHRTAGYYLVLTHPDGWISHYLHLDGREGAASAFAPGLSEGDWVEAGQLIGSVGNSGNARGTLPHTHFELHHQGRLLNPYPYLVQAWERLVAQWAVEIMEERLVR